MPNPISSGMVDKTIAVALNGLAARQRVISNNLANIDTPDYKSFEVHFEEQLQRETRGDEMQFPLILASTNSRHLAPETRGLEDFKPEVVRVNDDAGRADGNNINIDEEMVRLAETTLTYNALVQLISSRISLARYVVNEGRR